MPTSTSLEEPTDLRVFSVRSKEAVTTFNQCLTSTKSPSSFMIGDILKEEPTRKRITSGFRDRVTWHQIYSSNQFKDESGDENSESQEEEEGDDVTPPASKKQRKARTAFSDLQLQTLEKSFERHKYLSVQDRMELAAKLNLSDTQVKTWYQNRRTKWKRQTAVGLELLAEAGGFAPLQRMYNGGGQEEKTPPHWSNSQNSPVPPNTQDVDIFYKQALLALGQAVAANGSARSLAPSSPPSHRRANIEATTPSPAPIRSTSPSSSFLNTTPSLFSPFHLASSLSRYYSQMNPVVPTLSLPNGLTLTLSTCGGQMSGRGSVTSRESPSTSSSRSSSPQITSARDLSVSPDVSYTLM